MSRQCNRDKSQITMKEKEKIKKNENKNQIIFFARVFACSVHWSNLWLINITMQYAEAKAVRTHVHRCERTGCIHYRLHNAHTQYSVADISNTIINAHTLTTSSNYRMNSDKFCSHERRNSLQWSCVVCYVLCVCVCVVVQRTTRILELIPCGHVFMCTYSIRHCTIYCDGLLYYTRY